MSTLTNHPFFRLVVLGCGLSVISCAQEREPIDRTQPNYYDKSYFDGEWHYQRTVVGVPAANGFTFVGSTDFEGLTRVSWDIQEDFLYARRTTELVRHGDDRDRIEAEGGTYEGEVTAAFKITKHFDITYAYNPTTGEKLNILEENNRDRPWFERQYIRVDWSQNLVHNYDLDFETQSVESVPYFVQEFDDATGQRNPDAPVFENGYFDITNKLFAKAGTTYYPGYGDIPLCWLDILLECGAGEYTIRHSFSQLDSNRQYEPFPYKGKATEVFGYFWTDRTVYDETGLYTQNNERYLNRHNLWMESYDADGNTIPYAEREIRPLVYHVNRAWPKDDVALNEAALIVAEQWNDVFRNAVIATGKDPGNQAAFIFCPNNPVEAGDPEECGGVGNSPRIGDMRYSFMAYVPDYMKYGLLGLGPSNNDPETGEIISGMGYVYHHNNLAAERVLEMVDLLNGEITSQSFIDGVDLQEWIDMMNGEQSRPDRTFPLEEARHFVKEKANSWSTKRCNGRRHTISEAEEQAQHDHGVRQWMEPYLEHMYQEGAARGDGSFGVNRLARLEGTEIEEMLINDEVLMAVGHDPSLPVNDDILGKASIARGGLGQFMKNRDRIIEEMAEKRNAYLPSMADDALMGLAREMKDKNLTREEMKAEIRKRIYTAVLAHEVGHSVGLMHNFGASDDAINYFDEYWTIRSHDGTVEPRTQDPITEYEVNNFLYNYAYSSVMDYAGRYTIDGAGLGKYDQAAILYGYARKVEVWDDTHGVEYNDFQEWYNGDGDIIYFYGSGPQAVHYTYFYNTMGDDLFAADNRVLVDLEDMREDFAGTLGRDSIPRVPYIYCSHSRYNLGDSCLTRDFGADPTERMKNILDDLDTWYIKRNFPRGSMTSDNWNYVRRWYGRIYDRLNQWHNIYGLYADFLPLFYEADELETFFMDDETGWGTKTWAVQNAFNYLVQTVMMPDINDYVSSIRPDGTEHLVPSTWGDGLVELDITDARYFSTSWFQGERECGYFFWECLHHIGFYLDKIMAIEALSDSTTNFVGRSTPEDIREWEVSYYSTFPDAISKINRAIAGQQWGEIAPYWEDNELKFPNYAGPLDVTHANPIDPFATFTVQLYWQALGRARFSDNYDRSFDEESRVFALGTADTWDLLTDRLTTYTDPTTGRIFGAVDYDGNGAGEAMIDRANAMKARSSYCDNTTETVTTDDDCVAREIGLTEEQATAGLLDWNEVLKTMALMESIYDWGNPYDP